MKKLQILSLDHVSPSSANFVPPSVSGLCAIKTLDLGWCQLDDQDIPNNIGSLSSLQDLKLCTNNFNSLPSSLTQLSSLKLLDLTRCHYLKSLSGLPPNLQRLYAAKCTSMQNLPNLSNLIHLEELYLTNCSRLAEIHGLEKLSSITKINMGGCSNLANTFIRQSFFQYIHGLAARGVHYFHQPGPILQDVGFFLLPELGQERTYISETVFTFIFLSFVLDLHSPSMNQREIDGKSQKSLNEKQQENHELLIQCIARPLGFAGNRPIEACIIYKCLLQWRSFEVERTSVFDRIIQTIGHAIEKTQDNNDVLAYWLSNASTLLLLLQRTLKASGAAGMTPMRRRSSSATLFGRMTSSFRGTPQGVNLSFVNSADGVDTLHQVEAKYPAFLFKQQLTAYVEKIYGMIRDNLKKEISPLLGLCIQVPPFLVWKVFTQIFSFINVQLFNSLLLRRECLLLCWISTVALSVLSPLVVQTMMMAGPVWRCSYMRVVCSFGSIVVLFVGLLWFAYNIPICT